MRITETHLRAKLKFLMLSFLAFILCVLAAPMAHAQFYYEIIDSNSITITGYYGTNRNLTIPSTIVVMDPEAHSLPVVNIGSDAFSSSSLTSVAIPNGITNIGDGAFFECYSLTNATIPGSVISIGPNAFWGSDLTTVTIPASTIGDYAFYSCGLINVTLLDGVASIGNLAFADCAELSAVAIPDTVTNLNSGAFTDCYSLSTVIIPNSITSIEAGMFSGCTSLTNITIPDSVISIEYEAFDYCTNLTGVTIPNSVTSIGVEAFYRCYSLAGVVISDNVTNIGNGAFSDCTSLTNLTIPNSVTSIGFNGFASCTSLTNVCFEGNAPSDGGSIFGGDLFLYTYATATIYYVSGTTGWGPTFSGVRTTPCTQCPSNPTLGPSLQLYKTDGCRCSDAEPAGGDPIRVGTGNLFEQVTDCHRSGINTLSFTRYYNSLSDSNTLAISLGRNWRSTYDRYLRIAASVIAERADGQELIFNFSDGGWTSDSDVDIRLFESGSAWVLTDTDDTVETYDGTGLLTSIRSRDGYTQTMQYDSANHLASVTDSFGRMLQFAYQCSQLQSLTTPDGQVLTYSYVTNSGLITTLASVTYPTTPPATQSYLYEDGNLPVGLTGIIDENGNRYATWTYDAAGRALSSELGDGANLTTIDYNDADGSRTVTGPLGSQTVYKFAVLQNVPKVTEIDRLATATVLAAMMTYSYDTNGYIDNVSDWNTNVTVTVNDIHDQPLILNEAVGTAQARTTISTYLTNFHLPLSIVAPLKTSNFTYDTNGNLLVLTETATGTGTTPYSTSGQTRTWTNTYDDIGNLLTTTGPRTDVTATTTFTYDSSNNLSTITDPLGHVTRFTNYNGSGLPLTMIDANNVVTAFTYDARDRLLTRTVQAGSGNATTTFTYDAVGDVTAITLPDGSFLNYQYDAARRLQSVSNGLGETIDYMLDAAGDVIQENIKNASASIVKTQSGVFDQLSRVLQQIGAAGQATSFGYDANGNRISITDGLTNATARAFDPLNRLVTSVDPLHNATDVGYDAQDNLTSVIDPRLLVTSYVYDGFRHLIQENSPDKGTTVYKLDKAGNRTNEVDARGVVTLRTFDKLNRATAKTFPAASGENITYTYDATNGGNFGIGRLTGYTDETGNTTLTYNERGDVISATRTIGGIAYTTAYTYDLADHVTSITYPSGHVITYVRDSQGRISSATYQPSISGTPTTLATGVTYLPFGPLSGFVYGNGLVRRQTYDEGYRLTNITTLGTSASVQSLVLGYNPVNNVTSITDTLSSDRNQTFLYDPVYRLTNAVGLYGTDGYTYDADGNRQSQTAQNVTETYDYPATANMLQYTVKAGVTRNLTYTPNGNVSSDNRGTTTNLLFTYNNQNRYSTLTMGSTITATYQYNALGERLLKTVGSTTTHYHYDQNGHLIAESQPGRTLIREYVWLDDMPVAQIEGDGTVYYIHPDNLGRPQKMTDATQTLVWDNEQQPFGEAIPPILTSTGFNANNQFQMTVNGAPYYSYVVQASTNLASSNWVSLATNTAPFVFTDVSTSGQSKRFYRLLYLPNTALVGVTQNLRFPGQYSYSESGLNYNMMRDYDPTLGRYIQSDPIGLAGGINLYDYVGQNPLRWADRRGLEIEDMAIVIALIEGGEEAGALKLVPTASDLAAEEEAIAVNGDTTAAQFGRDMHAKYNPGNGYVLNRAISKSCPMRPDALNRETRVIRELKPWNLRAMQLGQGQLDDYVRAAQQEYGGTWTGYLDVYTPEGTIYSLPYPSLQYDGFMNALGGED